MPSTKLPNITTKQKQILNRILEGYNQFLNIQRSIHVTLTPEIGLGNKNVILSQKKMMTIVEKQSLSPLMSMFNEYFGPFKRLSSSQKVNHLSINPQSTFQMDIIADVLPDFGVLHRAFLTSHYFPEIEDQRVSTTCWSLNDVVGYVYKWILHGSGLVVIRVVLWWIH